MTQETAIKLFESRQVRTAWNEDTEEWYFSVVDVIEVLTDSPRPRKYWNALKTKLQAEGSELSHELGQLKLPSEDGKFYKTDVANTEQLFRLIQSIRCLNRDFSKIYKIGKIFPYNYDQRRTG